jgi:hypothetical protein
MRYVGYFYSDYTAWRYNVHRVLCEVCQRPVCAALPYTLIAVDDFFIKPP